MRRGDSGEAARILDYIKIKNAVLDAEKSVTDYHRKIEIASLRSSKQP